MLTTNDPAIFERAKIMRLHGINRDVWDRFTAGSAAWEYDVVAPGFKYNMPDVNAAIGLAQLERAEQFRYMRELCARFYFSALKGIESLTLPALHVGFEDHAWHLFPVTIRESATISRNCAIELLAERGIGTSVHYKPLHRMTYYRDEYRLKPEDFPHAEKVWQGCFSLPIYPSLSREELEQVARAVAEILA
jgi:dTDP-4-amino-4,6-dideoxygalactose transaminase